MAAILEIETLLCLQNCLADFDEILHGDWRYIFAI